MPYVGTSYYHGLEGTCDYIIHQCIFFIAGKCQFIVPEFRHSLGSWHRAAIVILVLVKQKGKQAQKQGTTPTFTWTCIHGSTQPERGERSGHQERLENV